MIKDIKRFISGMVETNSYIFIDENNNCVIVDPDGSESQFINFVKENELNLLCILLTHGHIDHIGAVEGIKKEFDMDVLAGELEQQVLKDPYLNASLMFGAKTSLEADRYLKDGEIVNAGSMSFKVMLTPGHTCGSVCYLIEDIIVSGDTLFEGSCGRADLPTGDWNTIVESLMKLKALKGDYRVLPGHGPATTLDKERRTNMFMR